MRRQFGVGGVSAGSSCVQLDPHSLPASFATHDARADGGIRHIEIDRDRIVVRRAVSGIAMALNIRVSDFLGIACRETEQGRVLMLTHRDPSLSVPLVVSNDDDALDDAWLAWSDTFALPQIENEDDVPRSPAPRRRRRNAIRARRPKFLVRRKAGYSRETQIYRDEREIIART